MQPQLAGPARGALVPVGRLGSERLRVSSSVTGEERSVTLETSAKKCTPTRCSPRPCFLGFLRVSVMVRTKERRNLSSQEQAASAERAARQRAAILKAARMLPPQGVAHAHVGNCRL